MTAKKQTAKSAAKKKSTVKLHVEYHKDGSVWATGRMLTGKPTGYWEWFRKDGSKMRSDHFERGMQVGEWTTYDRNGDVYKVTAIKPKKT
jgi:antitoxin component YwqK of YwqJK toxin-antitoxin module